MSDQEPDEKAHAQEVLRATAAASATMMHNRADELEKAGKRLRDAAWRIDRALDRSD